jgi:hypothetical protein
MSREGLVLIVLKVFDDSAPIQWSEDPKTVAERIVDALNERWDDADPRGGISVESIFDSHERFRNDPTMGRTVKIDPEK